MIMAANDSLPKEEWRTCPSRPQIEASSHGRIRRKPHFGPMPQGYAVREYRSLPSFGVITKSARDARHLYFGRYYRGIGNVKVHFAVCEAFHGPPPPGCRRVRHLNENGLDNRPVNLEWATQKVNLNDPKIKRFHYIRVSPFCVTDMTKREKREGKYESIEDVGLLQRRLRAANDNHQDTAKAA